MRAWFNGRMEASQALDEGSIPFARTTNFHRSVARAENWVSAVALFVIVNIKLLLVAQADCMQIMLNRHFADFIFGM